MFRGSGLCSKCECSRRTKVRMFVLIINFKENLSTRVCYRQTTVTSCIIQKLVKFITSCVLFVFSSFIYCCFCLLLVLP